MTRACSCGAAISRRNLSGLCRSCVSKRTNATRAQRNPVPADFAERSAEMSNRELAQHYGVGISTIMRFRKKSGVAGTWRAPPQSRPLPVPEDFADRSRRQGVVELASHYAVSITTISKWRRALGLPPSFRSASTRFRPGYYRLPGSPPQIGHSQRDMSLAGQAVDYLRRYGPVYRCRADGHADFSGQFWNRGGHVLSDQDVIDRARRLGFDPDAWRRIAA